MDILSSLLPELAEEYLTFFRDLRMAQGDAITRKDYGAVRSLAETITISMQGLSSLASLLNPPGSNVAMTIQTFDIAPLFAKITELEKSAESNSESKEKLDQALQQLTETKAALSDLQQKLADEESQYTTELADANKKLSDTQSALQETQDALSQEESKFQQLADLLKVTASNAPTASSTESAPEPGVPHPAQTTTTPAPQAAGGDQPTPPADPAIGDTLGVATGASSEVEPLN